MNAILYWLFSHPSSNANILVIKKDQCLCNSLLNLCVDCEKGPLVRNEKMSKGEKKPQQKADNQKILSIWISPTTSRSQKQAQTNVMWLRPPKLAIHLAYLALMIIEVMPTLETHYRTLSVFPAHLHGGTRWEGDGGRCNNQNEIWC